MRGWVARRWLGDDDGWTRALGYGLHPAEVLFRAVVALRDLGYRRGVLPSRAASVPVISVGNLTVGGAGKTPLAVWIAALLHSWGRRPAIVLRGYGADEILVHRELNPDVPVYAAKDRWTGAGEAAGGGADCVILDDGFQHRALRRDLDIVLVSAEQWQGNRRMLPGGPWREPVAAIGRADRIILTRKTASEADAGRIAQEIGAMVDSNPAVARLEPTCLVPLEADGTPEPLEWLRGREVLAVTTLADPRPVLTRLRAVGALVDPLTFPDHHEFSARDMSSIATRAPNRTVVMTRKEAVKLRGKLPANTPAFALDLRVTFETGENELIIALREALRIPG